MQSFRDLLLAPKMLNNQSSCWWFVMTWHCYVVTVMICDLSPILVSDLSLAYVPSFGAVNGPAHEEASTGRVVEERGSVTLNPLDRPVLGHTPIKGRGSLTPLSPIIHDVTARTALPPLTFQPDVDIIGPPKSSGIALLSKSSSSSIAALSKSSTDISFLSEKLIAPDVAVAPGALLPTCSSSDVIVITDNGSEQPDGLAVSVNKLLKILPPQSKCLAGKLLWCVVSLVQDSGNSSALAMELPQSYTKAPIDMLPNCWHYAACFHSTVIWLSFLITFLSMFQG